MSNETCPSVAIVARSAPVVLVGGWVVTRTDLLAALSHGSTLVAVDGGADTLLALGHEPVAVIGDMDSISPGARRALGARLHVVAEQETTDFDKALRSIEAPLVLGLGFSGGRLDHELAALNALSRHPERRAVMIGAHSICFLCPPLLDLPCQPGAAVSVFPLGPVTARSRGLEWALDGLALNPEGRIGTSNRAIGPIEIEPDGPHLLVILPRDALDGAVRSLLGSARWPARQARSGGPARPAQQDGPPRRS